MYDNSKDVAKWFQDGGDNALRYNYNLNQSSTVVDLGGFRGEFADKIYKKYNCNVLVFEPIKDFYVQCCKTNKHNDTVKIYSYGISGSYKGLTEISVEGDASSIFKADSAKATTEIYLNPVWHLFAPDGLGLTSIDLLKINVEGAEYEILYELITSSVIQKIKDIQVQFHNFVPDAEAKRQELHERLSKTHHLTYNYPFVWENWERNV